MTDRNHRRSSVNRWGRCISTVLAVIVILSCCLPNLMTVRADTWSGSVQSEAQFQAQLNQFPESYRAGLRAVHTAYPNYTFTADYVGMDFQEVVDYEKVKKVSAFLSPSWKAMYDSSFGYYENYNWATGEWYNSEGLFTFASREVIEYYVDPRNFLDTSGIYMFLVQTYDPEQTLDSLRGMLKGTYMETNYTPNKKEPNDVRLKGDYAAVIMEAAQKNNISPYVLASSIFIEHGYTGGTPLISGYYKANDGTVYKDYYNFFDIGASGTDSNNVIQNGLEYAKSQGWNSRYLSIVNGAAWIVDGYLSKNQNTYYYKEFNVINGWNNLWHQFSTAIQGAWGSQSLIIEPLTSYPNAKYASLDFRIPVYDNMPAQSPALPPQNGNLNNYYFTDLRAPGLTPAYTMANNAYTVTMTDDGTLYAVVPPTAVYSGATSYALSAGSNTIQLNVTSQTGYTRTYTFTVNASRACRLNVKVFSGNSLNIDEYMYSWVKEDGKWYCENPDGKRMTGWLRVRGKWYYMDSSGVMQTGWKKLGGKWYYLQSSGAMKTGWLKSGGKWYYLSDGGAMKTGWVKVSGTWYYLNSSGVMQSGWQKINDKWYYLAKNGAMQTGWFQSGAKWYYLSSGGAMVTGWKKIDGLWYYFNQSGVMQTGWVKSGGKWYYLNEEGFMVTGWQLLNLKWYCFKDNGVMQTGWVKSFGQWYYLGTNGAMQTGWVKSGNKWYYLDAEGIMQTGWITLNNRQYYLDESGRMVTGTITINGTEYTFGDDGVLAEE